MWWKFKYSKKDVNLILEFAKSDFKLRYRNNLFGYFWSIINPLVLLATLYFVFTHVMKLDVPNFQLFLLLGIIVWNFFSETSTNSLNSIISNSNSLKKHNIKVSIPVLSSCLTSLINLGLNFVVFFILIIIFKVKITALVVFTIIYIVFLVLITLGFSLAITGIYFYLKDIKHILSFLLLIGFWLSPVIYSEMVIPPDLRKFYMINPLSRIISHIRNLFIYDYFDALPQIIITGILSLTVLLLGIIIFEKLSKNFREKL